MSDIPLLKALEEIQIAISALAMETNVNVDLSDLNGYVKTISEEEQGINSDIRIYGELKTTSHIESISGDIVAAGDVTGATMHAGSGPNVAGAVMQVDGPLVVSDGAGVDIVKFAAYNGVLTITDTPQTVCTLPAVRGLYIMSVVSTSGSIWCSYILSTGTTGSSANMIARSGTYPIVSINNRVVSISILSGTANIQWNVSKL